MEKLYWSWKMGVNVVKNIYLSASRQNAFYTMLLRDGDLFTRYPYTTAT